MATLRFDNPFHDLWVTEILDPSAFVRMFSDVLVHDAEALFSSGNIVLKGRQGSGKSMLLTLLETTTRAAYSSTGSEYPVPSRQRKFISAGVQLTQQSAALIAGRAAEIPAERRHQTVAANFADYLNALLCRDLLKNVLQLAEFQSRGPHFMPEVPIQIGTAAQSSLCRHLKKTETWPEIVSECQLIEKLIETIDNRLRQHRLYANGSIDELPAALLTTRAEAGVPVAELAACLRSSGIVPEDTLILLRVDQHEELFELERHSQLGNVFRQVLNSALARRDPRIAYRIGTRHYAWTADLTSWGSGAPLEEERDYSVIDLDSILRRGEHSKGWKFPALARDVLRKRLSFAGFSEQSDPMIKLFGKSLDAHERARKYAASSSPAIRIETSWAPQWTAHLQDLWNAGEPLDAKFGEAWLRQDAQRNKGVPLDGTLAAGKPWRRSEWWAKERNEIALLQLAGDRQQALIWSGEKQIIDLAGTNILAFMTICKTVWATWQRRNPRDADRLGALPSFSTDDQLIGITEASQTWFKKIQVGFEADKRAKLVSALGSWFRRRMLEDRRLAYPGHNGFSLAESELGSDSDLMKLIKVCRDHGDLIETPHTTRNKSQERRIKWYLHPLLCPLFRIPYVRTKEPIYTTLSEVDKVFTQQRRQGPIADEEARERGSSQLDLPGLE